MHLGNNDLLVVRDLTMILLSFAGFLRFDEVSYLLVYCIVCCKVQQMCNKKGNMHGLSWQSIETMFLCESRPTVKRIIIRFWKSAPFWPIIHTGFKFRAFIKNVKVFKGYNIAHRGRGRNGIFGTPHQNSNFLALRIEP
jgi:hypothetical protein